MNPEACVTGHGPTALAAEDEAPSSAAMAAKFSALRQDMAPHADSRATTADRYVFGEVFARGGLGQVRRAFDPVLGRTIAVKEMLIATGSERFVREAQVTAQLEHPAVVPVHDLGVHANGQPYYCMKLIDGRSLDAVIAATRSLAERIVLLPHIVIVAEAVAFAHSKGLLHRDLKPANILVGNFGETWVIDWGLTGYLPSEDSSGQDSVASDPERARLTRTGEWMGTLPYMAPEQRRGQGIDERADVYGLGAVLYHTLSGQRPYGDVAEEELASRVIDHSPTDLAWLAPETPLELLAIVRKAMARSPEDRYMDVRALLDDLGRFLGGRLVAAHTYSTADVIRRWARRRRTVLSVVGLALAVLVMFGVYGVRRISDARGMAERNEQRATEQQHAAETARDDSERKGAETREALATRWEEIGRRELIELHRPLDALEPLGRALELAPGREYLSTMLAQARRPLRGLRCDRSTDSFDVVVVHPNLPLVALGSDQRSDVELWDTQTCVLERILAPGGNLRSLRFTADGAELLAEVRGEPAERILFDVRGARVPEGSEVFQTGKDFKNSATVDTAELPGCGRMFRDKDMQVRRGEAHPSGLVVALDRSGDVRVWNSVTRECVGAVSGHRVAKWRVVEVSGVTHLLTLDGDGRLSIWRVRPDADLEHVFTLNLDETGIFDFDAGVMSGVLVTIGREGNLRAWDLTAMMEPPELLRAPLMALHFDGDNVAVFDGITVRRTGLPSGGPMGPSWELPALEMLRWDADGTLAARRGTQLIDWDPEDSASPATLDVGHMFAPEGLDHDAVAGTPFVVVSGEDRDRRLHVLRMYDWRADRWHTFATSDQSQFSPRSFVGVSGARVLLGGTGTLIDANSGAVIARLDDSAVFTANGTEILSLMRERRGLARNDARTGQELGIIDPESRRPSRHRGLGGARARLTPSSEVEYRAVTYSPSGRAFAALGPRSQVTLWDEHRRQRTVVLEGHRLPPYRVLWSPDETRVLSFGNDDVAKFWDSETGQMYAELAGVWRGARAVFSLASPRMAIQEGEDRLTIVDTVSGARLFSIPTDSLVDVAFAPDGRWLYIVEAPPGEEMSLRAIELEDAATAAR